MLNLAAKEIDGKSYEFAQFPAQQSLKNLTRLSKLIGEPLSLLIALGSKQEEGEQAVSDGEILGKAAKALFDKMDSNEVISLIMEFTSGTACLCDGKKVNFDLHYQGKIGHLFKVFVASLEVQYKDFLQEILSLKTSLGSGIIK